MVCTSCHSVNSRILTPGKVYVVTTEKDIDPFGSCHFSTKSFIGDDGRGYLIQYNDGEFVSIEEWREMQLKKIL